MPDPTVETHIAVLEFRVGQLEAKVDALQDVPTTLATIITKLDALTKAEERAASRRPTPTFWAQTIIGLVTFGLGIGVTLLMKLIEGR
jgi:hypothetical protein